MLYFVIQEQLIVTKTFGVKLKKWLPYFPDSNFYRIFAFITHEAQAIRHTR